MYRRHQNRYLVRPIQCKMMTDLISPAKAAFGAPPAISVILNKVIE